LCSPSGPRDKRPARNASISDSTRRDRLDPLAAPAANRRAAPEEKRHVASQLRGKLGKLFTRQR